MAAPTLPEVLFSKETLSGIAQGRIRVAFRRWTRPRVKAGTRLRTGIGVIEVLGVETVRPEEFTDKDAEEAGFADRAGLDRWLNNRPGDVYRVKLRYAGPDPRVALRNTADFDDDEEAELVARLERMDRAVAKPWTWQTLRLIEARPGVVSTELADVLGEERFHFKSRVRRLKELGLTESLRTGYRVSPRGQALLDRHPLRPPD